MTAKRDERPRVNYAESARDGGRESLAPISSSGPLGKGYEVGGTACFTDCYLLKLTRVLAREERLRPIS